VTLLITPQLSAWFDSNRGLILSGGVLILPVLLALWSLVSALLRAEEERPAAWLRFRSFSRLILAGDVAAWWGLRDSKLHAGLSPAAERLLATWFAPRLAEFLSFCLPPMASLGLFLILTYGIDGAVLGRKWTAIDVLKLAWWRMLSFVAPLLLVATGADDLLQGEWWGFAWVTVAGAIAIVGMVFLRLAEGFRQREVKGSETRNRAIAIAKRMGVKLDRVYIVPAGRGHLTNAYAGGASIFLTDNLGKRLDKREIDSVMAHELGHIAAGHTLKKLVKTIAIYGATALVVFAISYRAKMNTKRIERKWNSQGIRRSRFARCTESMHSARHPRAPACSLRYLQRTPASKSARGQWGGQLTCRLSGLQRFLVANSSGKGIRGVRDSARRTGQG
jgi:Zn-dependent protease with chaperone function